MGLFGPSGGGDPAGDSMIGKEPSKALTGSFGEKASRNPNSRPGGLGLDAVYAQGQRMGAARRTQVNETKSALPIKRQEQLKKAESAVFSGGNRNYAPIKGDKGLGKGLMSKELMKALHIENSDQAKQFVVNVYGKEGASRESVLKNAKLIEEGKYGKIKGLDPKIQHYLENSKEAKKYLLQGHGRVLGGAQAGSRDPKKNS